MDEEEYYESLCRDTRTDEELALENVTLKNARRIMKYMLEQKADMKKHMADFKRLGVEIHLAIKATERDLRGIENEKAKANIIHRNRFIQHALARGIKTQFTTPALKARQ